MMEIFLLKVAKTCGIRDKSPEVKQSKRKERQAHNKVTIPVS